MSTALITIEGVLGEHSVIHGFYPIPEGIRLAHALRNTYRLVFGSTQMDGDAVEYWLRINGITSPAFYQTMLWREERWTDLDESQLRAEQAAHLRRSGDDLGLVVSADPEAILQVTEMGIPSLLFVNPHYRWSEYRPDRKRLPREWQKIDDEMSRQLELKATDRRLSEEEEVERI
jgi:hypothetical protein